ncbi:MAG TPA: hypothetical protein VHX13_07505 [Acidobacteriaceae bacterium]|jgi:hypothetical protein|nr:hypothetical protein [Acidobacteriaceae bacterium]
MTSLEELKSKFLVSGSLSEAQMHSLLQLAVNHCAVDAKGNVEIKNPKLPARDKLMLVLAARFVAHALEESIPSEVSIDELVRNTRVASEQVRARTSDLVKDRQIEMVSRGSYRALLHRIEPFLSSLAAQK